MITKYWLIENKDLARSGDSFCFVYSVYGQLTRVRFNYVSDGIVHVLLEQKNGNDFQKILIGEIKEIEELEQMLNVITFRNYER